jgi:hypothetical protein
MEGITFACWKARDTIPLYDWNSVPSATANPVKSQKLLFPFSAFRFSTVLFSDFFYKRKNL